MSSTHRAASARTCVACGFVFAAGLLWSAPAGPPAAAAQADAAGGSAPPAQAGKVILSNESYLRAFLVFKTPVFITKDGQVKVALEPVAKDPKPLLDYQSPPPPADWTKVEFDDFAWDRQRAPIEIAPGGQTGHSQGARFTAPPNSLICLRGKFLVDDPAKAQDLRLSLEYVGGAVVYVNGEELTRGHIPAGPVKADTLAEKYPDDLYCEPDGMYLADAKKNPAGFARRYRRLADVAVPAKLLKKGTNVLAVDIHRAPINEAAIAAKRIAWPGDGMYTVPGMWATAGLKGLSLSSTSAAGVVPNVARPKGVQVWNVAPFGTVTAFDYGDPGDPLPIVVAAAKNAVFSGRLVVSSDQAIKGLKVAASDLKQTAGGATLPASAVRVRYAKPAVPAECWTPPQRFNGLADTVPAEVPVSAVKGANAGAVASLWFTVRVPKDAKAGTYEGTVTVEAEGLKPTAVPFRVTVSDWTMSDPKDFRQHHLIFVSQEAVAKHYGVPLWSDKHFELMGKSLALLAEVNSREIPINLGTDFYGRLGNEETMVRWVRQADGSFKYDWTVFDKYCDLVAKTTGKPLPLRLNCWGESDKDGKNTVVKSVSVFDPATGKITTMDQPPIGTDESIAFWKPVVDEALKKLEARGWLDVSSFGHNSYCYHPKPQVVSAAKKIWPNGVWSYTAHNGTLGGAFVGTEKGVTMPIKVSVCVWTEGRLAPRGYAALLKPRPSIWCDTARTRHRDYSPLIVVRNLPEEVIMRGQDGAGDFGGDLFPVKNQRGGYMCLGNGRGTGGPGAAQVAILAPGPDGAISTERFETFREGTELGEALLFLEKSLQDKKISGDLAQKVNRYLDERSEVFIRYWYERRPGTWDATYRLTPPGLAERDARLLALCAEVAAAGR